MSGSDIKAIGVSFLQDVSVTSLKELADDTFRKSFEDLVHQLNADAGALWIIDKEKPEELTIAVNVGSRGSSIEGHISQELSSGLVSKAFREETVVHDEGAFRDPEKSYSVDVTLGQMTNYQIAMPFFMFGQKVGAVTAVQVSTLEAPSRNDWGFKQDCVERFSHWVAVAQRLLEYSQVRRDS
jgi:hypothetical protein